MKLIVKLSALLLLSSSLRAEVDPALASARMDFKKTNETYARIKGLSIDTYYMVYTDHLSKSVLEGKNGRYIKYGDKVFTEIDGIETYVMDDKIISISPDNRQITVGDNRPIELSPLQTNLDTLLSMCDEIQVEQVNPNEKKYKLYLGGGSEFSQVDIHIDTKNLRYVRIVLYYAMQVNFDKDFFSEEKQPRLEIIYKNFKQLDLEPSLFDQSLYLQNVGNKLVPAPKYFNYKVLDLRNRTNVKTKQ